MAHTVVRAEMSKNCSVGQQAGNVSKVDVAIVSLKSIGQLVVWEFKQDFSVMILKQNSFSGKLDFALKVFN